MLVVSVNYSEGCGVIVGVHRSLSFGPESGVGTRARVRFWARGVGVQVFRAGVGVWSPKFYNAAVRIYRVPQKNKDSASVNTASSDEWSDTIVISCIVESCH